MEGNGRVRNGEGRKEGKNAYVYKTESSKIIINKKKISAKRFNYFSNFHPHF